MEKMKLTEKIKADAEVTHTLSNPSDVHAFLGNIGGIIAEKMLEVHGFYACKIANVKTLFVIA